MDLLLDGGLGVLVGLFLFTAVWLLARWTAPPGLEQAGGRELISRWVRSLDPRLVGVGLAGCTAILTALGAATLIWDADIPAFVPNQEHTVPTFFSSVMLFAAGGLGLVLATEPGREGQRWWLLWGVVLVALGIDESAEFHERLEVRLDLPALVVLSPVALAAGVAGLATLRLMDGHARAQRLYVAGAIAWVLSQLTDPVHGVDWKSLIEETLEITGSSLFVIALLSFIRENPGGDGGAPLNGGR